MKKEEVELILIQIIANGKDALKIKIYKNGTTCRLGVGGLPSIGIGMISFVEDTRFFDPLLKNIPQELLDKPMQYEEPIPNGALEYILAFYGDSNNNETGEKANWQKSTGVRLKLDLKSEFKHQIRSFIDSIAVLAVEMTNEIYFDTVLKCKWGMLSHTLPKDTIITQPNTPEEINRDYENYIKQLIHSAKNWNIEDLGNDTIYERNGLQHTVKITYENQIFNLKFSALTEQISTQTKNFITARKKIANYLKQKYKMTESFKDNGRLTLMNSSYYFHLTLLDPVGDEIYIANKTGGSWEGTTFLGYFFDTYTNFEEAKTKLEKLFFPLSNYSDVEKKSTDYLIQNFMLKIHFLEENYSEFF